ncbi:hypothetical protein Y032_0286g1378 [Ancylostoma ceylanicum]|uniref:Uncharacterized protein n=1 Tax=Ancylostoma ceylanicum TaxID=53326 RepID=A0A016S5U2_9BILA|nr:hypothetical protein Y032_0286g1378 [Ancylostoma ceylanicum]
MTYTTIDLIDRTGQYVSPDVAAVAERQHSLERIPPLLQGAGDIVGVDDDDSPTASKSTRRDRIARAGVLSGTSNYRVFLIVSFLISYHQML